MKGSIDLDTVWGRIVQAAGEEFRLVGGDAFVFSIEGRSVVPDRTGYPISRPEFGKALELVPLRGPGEVRDLVRGPSYVYAILSDPRISAGEW
jgi:hypothetical protein